MKQINSVSDNAGESVPNSLGMLLSQQVPSPPQVSSVSQVTLIQDSFKKIFIYPKDKDCELELISATRNTS
jgi:hypothetical protein